MLGNIFTFICKLNQKFTNYPPEKLICVNFMNISFNLFHIFL